MKPVEISGADGLRNDIPTERFGVKDLAVATNIDIDKTGAKRRRKGYTKVYTGAVHSLWGGSTAAYFVTGTTLKELNADWSGTTRATLTAAGLPMSYEDVLGVVYYSNGVDSGVIERRARRAWGIAVPALPVVTAGNGGLRPGRYLYTITHVRAGGESGAPRSGWIDLAANQSLVFTLATPSDTTVAAKHIYISEPNGEALFRVGTVASATNSFTYAANRPTATICRTIAKGPPPPGQVIFEYNGRMYVAQDDVLWYSEPYEYELFDMARCFIPMGSRITVAGAVVGGIYVGTDQASIYLKGDTPENFEYRALQDGPAIPGTMVRVDGAAFEDEKVQGEALLWTTSRGVCLGAQDGNFVNLTNERYVAPSAVTGAAGVRTRDAAVKYAVSLFA